MDLIVGAAACTIFIFCSSPRIHCYWFAETLLGFVPNLLSRDTYFSYIITAPILARYIHLHHKSEPVSLSFYNVYGLACPLCLIVVHECDVT